MKRIAFVALAALTVLLAGCTVAGKPKAVTPDTKVDFGDVPVVADMNQAKKKEFVIWNEGTAALKLSDVKVKLLEGC